MLRLRDHWAVLASVVHHVVPVWPPQYKFFDGAGGGGFVDLIQSG